MRAISIRQPWVWAILNAGKGVENREWGHTPRWIVGQTIYMHASKGCTLDEYEDAGMSIALVSGKPPPALSLLPRGAIVATVRVSDMVRTFDTGHRRRAAEGGGSELTCLLCGEAADVFGHLPSECPNADPWAIPGCLGLVFDDVRPLAEPVPFKGALGFFDVPEGTVPS